MDIQLRALPFWAMNFFGWIIACIVQIKANIVASLDNTGFDEFPVKSSVPAPAQAHIPVAAPTSPVAVSNSISAEMTRLEAFCSAIRDFEGRPGDVNYRNNNPGNCRCSKVGYLAKYGHVRCSTSEFAIFPTYELGWEYLQAKVLHTSELHPNWTILDFFNNYAPTGDKNHPNIYAAFVAAHCGVGVDIHLCDLFKA